MLIVDLDTLFYDSGLSAYHTNFKISLGESLHLSTANETLDNVFVDTSLYYGLSQGRESDGSDNWCFFNTPTPNESNNGSVCYSGITTAPEVSHPSGWYANEISISQNQSLGVAVHYISTEVFPPLRQLLLL